MTKYLFLYGTLIQANPPDKEIARIVKRLHRVGTASVRGRLYDFGDFPGAVVDPSSNSFVRGELVELPDDENILQALDKYEEYDSANPRQSLFVRSIVDIKMADGHLIEGWIYAYNKNPGDAPLIRGGNYAKSKVA
jgi:gamma-glutamylcyclotransferase (GGCT)/AIG2-like uncharacterized protein YtfP